MSNIITQKLKIDEIPPIAGPVEQLTRVVAFYGDSVMPHAFGSGFFDPARPGFLITAAHVLAQPHGLASSVKVKGYDAKGKKISLWGRAFALYANHTAGIGVDIAVVRLQTKPTLAAAATMQTSKDGYISAYLRAYNSDASFELRNPETSAFKALATKDRLIYQSGSGTAQMSGAPVIRSDKPVVAGIHKGISEGHFVAARIDLDLLNALCNALLVGDYA